MIMIVYYADPQILEFMQSFVLFFFLMVFRKRFVENFMNVVDPSRETDRDYSAVTGLPTFPIALQAIQQLVKSEHSDKPIFESSNASSGVVDQNHETDPDKSPSNDE